MICSNAIQIIGKNGNGLYHVIAEKDGFYYQENYAKFPIYNNLLWYWYILGGVGENEQILTMMII